MDTRGIDDLAKRLAASVPDSLRGLREDLADNFHAVLQSGLAKMDLVTREEFEVQAALLREAERTLRALSARVAELEGQDDASASD